MDYCPDRIVKSDEFIITSTGNIISRKASIGDPRNLEIPSGKCFVDEGCAIASDVAPIQMNRYCFVEKNVRLQPCQTIKEPVTNIKMTIGANTYIGEVSHIQAARIGAGCIIGSNVTIGPRCILKDYVKIEDGSVVAADMVLPPFAIVSGNPARIIGEQPESTSTTVPICADDRYKSLKTVKI